MDKFTFRFLYLVLCEFLIAVAIFMPGNIFVNHNIIQYIVKRNCVPWTWRRWRESELTGAATQGLVVFFVCTYDCSGIMFQSSPEYRQNMQRVRFCLTTYCMIALAGWLSLSLDKWWRVQTTELLVLVLPT